MGGDHIPRRGSGERIRHVGDGELRIAARKGSEAMEVVRRMTVNGVSRWEEVDEERGNPRLPPWWSLPRGGKQVR